jgi:hypothetical protein
VVGEVALWGRVIEHTKGWRAEFAYPRRLRLTCPWCVRTGDWPATPEVVAIDVHRWCHPTCANHAGRAGAHLERAELEPIERSLLETYGARPLPEAALPSKDRIGALTMGLRVWDRRRVARSER